MTTSPFTFLGARYRPPPYFSHLLFLCPSASGRNKLFDFQLNYQLALSTSVDLAVAYGVPDKKILHSVSDVDAFMLG